MNDPIKEGLDLMEYNKLITHHIPDIVPRSQWHTVFNKSTKSSKRKKTKRNQVKRSKRRNRK